MTKAVTAVSARLQQALDRIADRAGDGGRAFLRVYDEQARATASALDILAAGGLPLGSLGGRIVSIKDLFDVAGEPTTAGSVVLKDAPPAAGDAPVVARLRRAGAVIIGKTNMTEFAYSGVGLNPHYGTPGNPYDRARIPGGSTSGGAVAVADGMCEIAIGSDTGGSVRLPAALCGIVGFKPTARRVPLEGVLPLSSSLDSVGPLARSVADCALTDAVLAGEEPAPLEAPRLTDLRLAVLTNVALDQLDAAVTADFNRALASLRDAGAQLREMAIPLLADMAAINAKGGFAAAESYAWHRELLAKRGDGYDPRVRVRIEAGAHISAADYIAITAARRRLIAAFDEIAAPYDAIVLPTCPLVAPPMAAFTRDDDFRRLNMLLLRNTMIGNFFDLCGVSLPMMAPGAPPTGLMLMGRHGTDRRLLALAAAVEAILRR